MWWVGDEIMRIWRILCVKRCWDESNESCFGWVGIIKWVIKLKFFWVSEVCKGDVK